MSTPYSYPQTGGESAPPMPVPAYTLFDANSVTLATLLGSPVAGTILMAVNYRRLRDGGKAVAAVVLGLVVTLGAVLFGNLIPYAFSTCIAIGLLMGTRSSAQILQGPAVADHVSQGGKLASRWAAAGIGVTLLAAIVSGAFLVVYERQVASEGSKVTIGANCVVYYSGSATEQDAKALGGKLKEIGYFADRASTVFLTKDQGGPMVSFTVKEGIWDQANMVTAFEQIGGQVAPLLGAAPLKVRLVDTSRAVKKEMTAGKVVMGTQDEVYYFDSATEADAKALGQALVTIGYFKDLGTSVLLSKAEGTVISFVVKEGIWDKPKSVAAFEDVARQAALSVGGLPIKLRLVNAALETRKEVAIQ